MAMAGNDCEEKLRDLLSLMKWSSTSKQTTNQITCSSEALYPCTAKGTGLSNGIVNKSCKFSIITKTELKRINLRIKIKGPDHQRLDEIISDVRQSSRYSNGKINLLQNIKHMTYSMLKRSVSSHSNSSQESIDLSEIQKIPFEYFSKSPGHFIVSYVPRLEGTYDIRISWDGESIPDSPFSVHVATNYDQLNRSDDKIKTNVRRMWQKKVSFSRQGSSQFNREAFRNIDTSREEEKTTIRAVLNRNSTVHRSIIMQMKMHLS